MGHCTLCGDEQQFPFECGRCGRTFCSIHRLPENHLCPGASNVYYESPPEPNNNANAESYSVKVTPATTSHKKLLKKFAVAAIALLLVIMLVASLVFVYHSNEVTKSYWKGYDQGKQSASESTYESGYELGFAEGNQSGSASAYELGFAEGRKQGLKDRTTTGYYIRDPSYNEMINFLSLDQTNNKTYDIRNYNCYDYSKDICDHAFEEGYRCGFVYIELSGAFAHAIVCFNTTDRGVIFIEPQSDEEVVLKIGEHYNIDSTIQYLSSYSGFSESYIREFYDNIITDDIVENYNIIW